MPDMVVIPEELQQALWVDLERMSGAVCFRGTRVPVQALLDTLYQGLTVENFLDGFEGITLEQAMAVVRWEQMEARRMFGIPVPG